MSLKWSIPSLMVARTPPTTPLLLDSYPGAAAAYSVRKLSSSYSGSAIRVRRSSDNTEQDIGFNSSGGLDTNSLLNFVSGGDGYITKWYDQSGNSRDGTQATTANQPSIVLAGVVQTQGTNNRPALNYNGGSNRIEVASFTFSQPTTHFILGKADGTSPRHFIDGLGGSRQIIGVNGANLGMYAGASLNYGTYSTNYNIYYGLFNSTSSAITYNANTVVTGDAGTSAMSAGIYIGSGGADNAGIIGYMGEVVLYASDQSANKTNIIANIDDYYGIF